MSGDGKEREGKSEGVDESERRCEFMQAYMQTRDMCQVCRFHKVLREHVESHEEDSSSGRTSHSQSRTCRITYCWTRTRLIPDPSKALKPKTRFSF